VQVPDRSDGIARDSVRRFVLSPTEVAPVPPLPNNRLRGRRLVVAGRRTDMAAAVVSALRFQGASVVQYDAEGGAAGLRARLGTIDGIVDLNIDEPLTTLATGQWEPALRRSLALIRACYDDWAAESSAERLFYMAVTQMGGTLGLASGPMAQPLGGIWAGLAKTLPREIPNCNVRVLDLSPDAVAHAAELIARELYQPGYFEIGYCNGFRYSLLARDEEPGAPDHLLTASDVVLLSGGARGIGLALAEDLAGRFGCRIVVTGRTPVPAADQPFVLMDDGQFRAFQYQRLKDAAGSGQLAQVRAENGLLGKQRRLLGQLSRLHEQGLRVEYIECDVTSPSQVRAAVERAGGDLSVVVHNAGVDAPVRLPAKSDDVFLSVVRTKVDGFLGLLRAVEESSVRLKMFCNVGSLTGRWGGMVGEIDYAAANEALSRLGLWASRRTSFPVKTLCWPTWERLGMIKNFDVAATYSSALAVAEGVSRWRDELLRAQSGDVVFMGALGNLGSPVYLKGFPPAEATANIASLYTQYHFLGDVVQFRPGRELRSVHRVSTGSAPLMHEFEVDGCAALPLTTLLEFAVAAGEWIQPDGPRPVALTEITDIRVNLLALKAAGGECLFERLVRRAPDAGSWTVAATFAAPGDGSPFASAKLVYGASLPSLETAPQQLDAECSEAQPAATPGLHWRGLHLKLARWRASRDGRLVAVVRSCPESDLWSTVRVPAAAVSFTALENIVRAASPQALGPYLGIARLLPGASRSAELTITGCPARQRWTAVDASGRTVLQAEGITFSTAAGRLIDEDAHQATRGVEAPA
jgi:NAD(P)-dependent dehydrogenase (short-subunit alcohol dehydrogenase family)